MVLCIGFRLRRCGRSAHILAGHDEHLRQKIDVDIQALLAAYTDTLVPRCRRPSTHSATSQLTSLPQESQPGCFRLANSSKYGPAEHLSMIAYCSSGL